MEQYFYLDPSITRGLDYYTGVVFETFLTDIPEIGSVCSGGRYNNLASLYTKEQLPGVGSSIGLDRLIAALEARDPYTRGHSETVATLVEEMGRRMNIDAEGIESLAIAGRLHDIGKIGVPDNILLKPGRLSEAEFAVIRQHPTIGASILSVIPSIKPLLPVILHHHERLDGRGYPGGLKGDEIMLWARMTAVADTYHALISDRPYRRGVSHEQAMDIIEDVRGTQLCPDCVDAFKKSLP
ncbi:MAG: HD domain-containing protein [Proteobacteria bacterium]|nr:HD domain-containing protein [Pseudomonadota bacterium]